MKKVLRFTCITLVLILLGSMCVMATPALTMSKKADVDKALDSKMPTILMITSDACTTCEDMKKYLPELAEQYKNKINIMMADSVRTPEIRIAFGVRVVPTTLFFDQYGDMVKSYVGPIELATMNKWMKDLSFIN